ncbi:ATPase inhibitor A, mitochondrial [Drosophila novamexicana]|uniref:ATPase inhibitor A, mitochondrial n=1 Tax=Drosophila novamexicana TaxID=47314 RepID=UPI0011E5C4B5|nr:ATPase inhibitor A, mitochondrial [Drosophila novamexicana]
MFTLRRLSQSLYPKQIQHLKMSHVGELGCGAGKGGGGGGAIREAGGSFGKMEAAHEEQFFHKQQKEQLKNLKNKTDNKTPDVTAKK